MQNKLLSTKEKCELLGQGKLNRPHDILGIHIDDESGCKKIRVFCPNAVKVGALDYINNNYHELQFQGFNGIYEKVIEENFTYKLICESSTGERWEYIDPYQFDCTLTADDLYLFGIGRDYEIYNKLGANFIEVNGIRGVRFAIWAPKAQRVSVIGRFNNWDGRVHQMSYIESHGVWEIFIPDLGENELYRFEIYTMKNELLYKTDPYANCYEVRPKNSAITYNMDQYKWKDTKWMNARLKKEYCKLPMSIYEMHLGTWRKNNSGKEYTYVELADQIVSYVKEMGYTHVEFMGISEYPFDGSWGYQVTGYYAPTSRYGTPDDFKYLVDTLHRHNIGVILDWVPAHFPRDAFGLEKFDGLALYEKDNENDASHPHWGTLIFDYAKPQVSLFLIGSALSWMKRYHIDGLRVDAVASMLYLDYGREGNFTPNKYGGKENIDAVNFLQHLNKVAYELNPGIMMIAEESTAWPKVTYPTSEDGLGFGFKWNMGWMNDFLSYMQTPPEYRSKEHGKVTFSLVYAFSENFIQVISHDEVVHGKAPMLYKMPGGIEDKFANLRIAYGYLYMHPGKKMLFMGNEIAEDKEWNEETEVNWSLLEDRNNKGILEWNRALNKLYVKEKTLWEAGSGYENFEWIDCDNYTQSIIIFIRKNPETEEEIIVIINFGDKGYDKYRIGVPKKVRYKEILNSDKEVYGGNGTTNSKIVTEKIYWHGKENSVEIKVPPLSMIVLKEITPPKTK